MTSILSYPTSDPFASSVTSTRYDTSSDSDPSSANARENQSQRPSTAQQSAMASDRQGSGNHGADEFGAVRTTSAAPTTYSAPPRTRISSGGAGSLLPVSPSEPIASTSTTHASSHSHTAVPAGASTASSNAGAAAQRARNRQSHNPSATLNHMNPPSPPRPEHLSDEFVLHPSVYNYKQAHPKRPMVAFGPYVLLQTLGEGEFGKVKLGVHTEFGVEVAIKLIRRGSLEDEVRASKVEREIDVLKSLRHPNIVRMFDVIDTEKYIGIVLEMAGGGELFDHILASRYLKEKDAQKLFAQLISGVDYLHKKHIVHRDLKLENLLLDKHRNIIITDFGFANRFVQAADDLMSTSCGSPCYAAPELVVSEGLYVGSAVDVWSCGVILYAMLSGYLPYDDDPQNPDGDNINLLYKYIMTTRLHFPDHMSPAAKHLLQIMLVPNPELRCTIPAIMEHPWLANYRDIFLRTPEESEYIFQETMYVKSQQAKRELAERRRVQSESRQIKQMQRSQSSAPGVSVSAADQRRTTREARHHSAMPTIPTATTVPDKLYNAGNRTPPLSASYAKPIAAAVPAPLPETAGNDQAAFVASSVPAPIPQPTFSPLAQPIDKPVEIVSKPQLQTHLSNTPSSLIAVENESIGVNSAAATRPSTPPSRPESESKQPMSANKNRHTIQVEYDMDASYERMQQSLAERGSPKGKSQALEASNMDLQPVTSDIEMESASDHDGRTEESTMERITPETSHIMTPPAVILPIPETEGTEPPSTPGKGKGKGKAVEEPMSPSTPRGKRSVPDPEDTILTPRQKPIEQATPRASIQPIVMGTKRSDSMPGAASIQSGGALNAAGLPLPPTAKPERSRKGMSLDKFGLARLLGQTQNTEDKTPPVAFGQGSAQIKRGSMSRPPTAGSDRKTDKKSKRKTIQLMGSRSTTSHGGKPVFDSRPSTEGSTPLSPRDLNPSIANKAQPSPPIVSETQVHHPHGQSAPSVVTLDNHSTAQQKADAKENKRASSGPAQRVMAWFRGKTHAKNTLSEVKTSHLRSDSTTSFVQVSGSPAHRAPVTVNTETANAAMSSTSSFARTAENTPTIAFTETMPSTEPTAAAIKKDADDAHSKSTGYDNNQLAPPTSNASSQAMPNPARTRSHGPALVTPMSVVAVTELPSRPLTRTATVRSDDLKMRLHSGIVDQSALSSKPPREVMEDVLRVMQDMGMDVKRENDFKLRCVRVRKRKAGATTGLGLGSVMSVGSTMGSFSILGNASASKTDSRGLPLPTSPSTGSLSGGLKGMLLRRGSSYSSSTNLPRSESALSETNLNSPRLASPVSPVKETLYGEHSIDSGDEVRFNIELCRLKNLPGLYLLTVKRLKGNHWSFKFIYQTMIDRCETLTH